jgi:hypothetical protein
MKVVRSLMVYDAGNADQLKVLSATEFQSEAVFSACSSI